MMKMPISLKGKNGITLIELLVVLVISSIIAAALYRTFIGQQKTYTVQEQVVDMQQNARVAINRMISDIRMVGFGKVASVTSALSPNTPVTGALTIAMAGDSVALKEICGPNRIKVDNTSAFGNMISIAGVESHNLDAANPPLLDSLDGFYIVTLKPGETVLNYHPVNSPVYGIATISYEYDPATLSIRRNGEIVADNIESLQFRYYTSSTDEVGTDAPANPQEVQRIRVTVIARTSMSDPDYKGGDGFRRRQISSYIMIRNPIAPN